MKPLPVRHAFVGLAFYTTYVSSLSVTPGSQCESACAPEDGSDAVTTASDIVCKDKEYDTTEEGRRFKRCVECLKDSERTDGEDSDLSALLFNFRFAVDTCLFDDERGSTGKASEITGCLSEDACLPLEDAIVYDNLEEDPKDMYGYCTAKEKAFLGRHTQSCLTCLHSSDDHIFLSNFLTVLTGGCAYKPEAGERLHYEGDVFSRDEILIEAPNQEDTDAKPITPADSDSSSPSTSGGLSREFVIGIVVGVCILFGIAILLFFIYYLRFRKPDKPSTPDLFPRHQRRSLRHQRSIDPDPALFGGRGMYPWSSDSDGESVNGAEYFDYVNATAMERRPEGEGTGMPAHRAYKPYIRSKNRVDDVDDGNTVSTGEGSNWNMKALEAGSVRAPSSLGRY